MLSKDYEETVSFNQNDVSNNQTKKYEVEKIFVDENYKKIDSTGKCIYIHF